MKLRLLAAVGLALPQALNAQSYNGGPSQGPRPPQVVAATLPIDLRSAAMHLEQAAQLAYGDSAYAALYRLAGRSEGMEYLLALALDQSQSRTKRIAIIDAIRWQRNLGTPMAVAALGQLVAGDSTAELGGAANAALRLTLLRLERSRLARQIDMIRGSGPSPQLDSLYDRDEELLLSLDDVHLPRWLRVPPTTIVVKPASSRTLRFLVMGDFGASRGVETQIQVATAIRAVHHKKPFEAAITLGDNFYGYGLDDPAHPRWRTQWEDLYTSLGIPFYASLGNHDWGGSSPAGEISYTAKSKSWRLPAPYYTWIAGPVQFFVIETDMMAEGSERQRAWLAAEIAKSTATWKIVYGHFPLRTQVERDGKSVVVADDGMNQYLLPIIENKVDVYFAGHHHSQQHHQPIHGVEQFISGTSGYKLYPVGPGLDSTVRWAKTVMGFVAVDVTPTTLTATYYDDHTNQIYSYTVKKKTP